MKNLIFALVVLFAHTAFASTQFVPNEYLAVTQIENKIKSANTNDAFSEHIDHLLSVQQQSLEKLSTNNRRLHLSQLVTSFSVSKTGLLGFSALSASSATNLFWNKKATEVIRTDEAKSFTLSTDDDELSLQMKVDEVVDFLVKQDKVKDPSKLRENLEKAMRRGHEIFSDVANLETPNFRVGGYRLDLSIGASGVVYPFTKVGENVRLWIEWMKPAKPNSAATPNTKITRFVSQVLNDTEAAAANINMPNFEFQNLFIGLGEDVKAGFFGFGSSTFGFVGYVKFVKKPKTEMTKATLIDENLNEEYPVINESLETKTISHFTSIPRKNIRNGIQRSLNFAQLFATRVERIESTHWELGLIRETATITKAGLFGLSNLNTKGIFVFNFIRKKPQPAVLKAVVASVGDTNTSMSLIRLSFVTVLGYSIPQIANVELRPNIEFFWK